MVTGRLHTREDSGLRIDREGRWFHDGEEVDHPKIVAAWNRGIERSPEGRYLLRFGNDWCFIEVEDAPLQVRTAQPGADEVRVSFSSGLEEALRPATLSVKGEALYCESSGGLPARFSRSAQAALSELVEEDGEGYALRIGSVRVPLR